MQNWKQSVEKIIGVAIKQDGVTHILPAPNRHHDVIKYMDMREIKLKVHEQGFITDSYRFIDRTEGAKLALESGQITELKFNPNTLFSEDLW